MLIISVMFIYLSILISVFLIVLLTLFEVFFMHCKFKNIYTIFFLAIFLFTVTDALAERRNGTEISEPALGGYDPVSYFESTGPLEGDGHYFGDYKGGTYLFKNAANKEKFLRNPQKYVPQLGGFCAYGVVFGKKFHSNPKVWKIVDGKLYLNLSFEVKRKWGGDIENNISKAKSNWEKIEHKHPSAL